MGFLSLRQGKRGRQAHEAERLRERGGGAEVELEGRESSTHDDDVMTFLLLSALLLPPLSTDRVAGEQEVYTLGERA